MGYIRFRPPDSDLSYNAKEQLESAELENHSSLGEGVVELKEVYKEEEERRNSLESKIGGLIAINGIVLSLLQLNHGGDQYTLIESSILVLFIASTSLCLWNILPKEYETPFALREYPSFTNNQQDFFKSQQYIRYYSSTLYNREYNNYRYTWFIVSFTLTSIAIVLVGGNALFPLNP